MFCGVLPVLVELSKLRDASQDVAVAFNVLLKEWVVLAREIREFSG